MLQQCTFGDKMKVDIAVLLYGLNMLFRLIGTRVENLLTDWTQIIVLLCKNSDDKFALRSSLIWKRRC